MDLLLGFGLFLGFGCLTFGFFITIFSYAAQLFKVWFVLLKYLHSNQALFCRCPLM